jgi:nucleoside-diphosphate-sugar epimerase
VKVFLIGTTGFIGSHLARVLLQHGRVEYHKITNTRVDANTAQQIREGYLVVSASEWVHPEWDWLRASHQPVARTGCTLFMYQMGN